MRRSGAIDGLTVRSLPQALRLRRPASRLRGLTSATHRQMGTDAGVAESSSVTGQEISAVPSGRLLYTRCRRLASRISFGMLNCSKTIDLPSATVIGLPSVSRSS